MATQDANHLHAFGVDVADPGRSTPEDQLSIEHDSTSRRMPARFRYSSKPRARSGNKCRRVEPASFIITRASGRRHGEALQGETARGVRAPR